MKINTSVLFAILCYFNDVYAVNVFYAQGSVVINTYNSRFLSDNLENRTNYFNK